jgi:two-component system LytT family response regulator
MSSFLHNSSGGESTQLAGQPGATLRILVAEADATSSRLMRSILENESDVTVEFIDDSNLLSAVQEMNPDLVILDMQTNAIRRAANWEALGVKSPPATIVTSYDASSLIPFASAVADLLIKPFNVEQFQDAIEAARLKVTRARSTRIQFAAQELNHESLPGKRPFVQRLAAESEESIVLLNVRDVLWLQSFGNRIRVHSGNATHLMRCTMKKIQVILDPRHFLRVHRNAIVNLDHVVEFFLPATGNMFVKLDNGACLPLRRATRSSLRRLLSQHFVA